MTIVTTWTRRRIDHAYPILAALKTLLFQRNLEFASAGKKHEFRDRNSLARQTPTTLAVMHGSAWRGDGALVARARRGVEPATARRGSLMPPGFTQR
jgi:hypothetical protein